MHAWPLVQLAGGPGGSMCPHASSCCSRLRRAAGCAAASGAAAPAELVARGCGHRAAGASRELLLSSVKCHTGEQWWCLHQLPWLRRVWCVCSMMEGRDIGAQDPLSCPALPHCPPLPPRSPARSGRVLRAAGHDQLQRVPPAAEGRDHHQVLAHVLQSVHQAQPRWAGHGACGVLWRKPARGSMAV